MAKFTRNARYNKAAPYSNGTSANGTSPPELNAASSGKSADRSPRRRRRGRLSLPFSGLTTNLLGRLGRRKSSNPAKPAKTNADPTAPEVKRDRKRPIYRRRWFWLLIGTGVVVGGGTAGTIAGVRHIKSTLPDTSIVSTFSRDGTLTVRAANNRILYQRGPATREKLEYDRIPETVVQAFIAAEDRRFYQHEGVDYQGIARAAVSNVLARDLVEGGSTITQQLARIVFLNQERTVWRKTQEIFLAWKLEEEMKKEEILERYLNLVYLGSGAYGVADASWVYFNKPLQELSLSEVATIAGLAPAPSVFSPLVNEEVGLQRRNLVLNRLEVSGYITASEAAEARNEPLELNPTMPRRLLAEAPFFTTYIEQQLPKHVPAEVLEVGGLTVETSLKPEWQEAAEKVVKETVEKNGRWQHFEEASLVAIDPRNGEIRAMVGGTEFTEENQYNRATQAQRQPGSTFKTFVYATAVAAGISPNKYYVDAPYKVAGYQPQNFSKTHSGSMSIAQALISSVNVVAVKVLVEVGFEPTIEIAKKMGIESELMPTYSLALGASEVNLLELTNAYGTLANEGMYIKAHGIRRILDRSGKVIYEAKFKPKRAISKDTSNIMTWMLKSVVYRGTGRPAQIGRQVAGKTGTSDKARDLWFVGYIPQVVAGVWLGNDNNKPTWGASSTAAAAWRQFMLTVVKDMEVKEFPGRPKLEGRKAEIKAKPVKRGRTTGKAKTAEDRSTPSRRSSGSTSSTRRSDSPSSTSSSSGNRQGTPSSSGTGTSSNSSSGGLSMDEVLDPGAGAEGIPAPPPAAPAPAPAPAAPAPAPAAPAPAPAPAAPAPAPAAPAPAPAPAAPAPSGGE